MHRAFNDIEPRRVSTSSAETKPLGSITIRLKGLHEPSTQRLKCGQGKVGHSLPNRQVCKLALSIMGVGRLRKEYPDRRPEWAPRETTPLHDKRPSLAVHTPSCTGAFLIISVRVGSFSLTNFI
jgi:hypothetical protein